MAQRAVEGPPTAYIGMAMLKGEKLRIVVLQANISIGIATRNQKLLGAPGLTTIGARTLLGAPDRTLLAGLKTGEVGNRTSGTVSLSIFLDYLTFSIVYLANVSTCRPSAHGNRQICCATRIIEQSNKQRKSTPRFFLLQGSHFDLKVFLNRTYWHLRK